MSSEVATQPRSNAQRGRRANRGRGGGHANNARNGKQSTAGPGPKTPQVVQTPPPAKDTESVEQAEEIDESDVCWICAEPVKYYSVSECNHRTCHVCALRLRALYKKMECTFCKEPQPSVIFTKSPDALWSSYTPDMIPYKDSKLSISFETQEMMEDTLILLRFNCPDPDCDYIGTGWSDLKLHTRAIHGKLMCDICIRHKKVFAHEHTLYPPNILPFHIPSMYRSHKAPPKEQIEGGVHPLCEFCRECFFSDDELYKHMRENHEECFVCKRNDVKDQYFRNYEALEQHFTHAHYPCTQPQCLVRKFVVFGSIIDLKAHMVEEHGADMSARDRKDAQRLQAEFEFEEVGVGGRRGRRDRGDREREREPPPSTRPGAAGARRREAFSGNLTAESSSRPNHSNIASANASQQPSRRQTPSPEETDPVLAERNAAFVARVTSLSPNPPAAIAAIKNALRSYRVSESAARDLILTVWNILDCNLDGTASIINALLDLVDDEEKKSNLLGAWNGFKIEKRGEFPELVPTAIGTQWAGVASGRVLNAKHATTSRSSAQSSRQVLDRVARAAASSSSAFPPIKPPERFPTLGAATSGANAGFRRPQRSTAWSASASASASAPSPSPVVRTPVSIPGPGANTRPNGRAQPVLSKSAFPELPSSSSNTRVPKGAISGNKSLKNIIGDSTPAVSAWDAAKSGTAGGDEVAGANTEEVPAGGKGKKGKGKQKQTLFTLGVFPT